MTETIFTYGAPQLKFGEGASAELGHDLAALGMTRVLVITDAGVAATGTPERIAESIRSAGLRVEIFADARVEPTDVSMQQAVDHARATGPWDGFVAVGGGSSIDTAKAVNLLLTNPGSVLDYVNAPVGGGRAPENPLLPLVAVPTTTGTGAESTTVCVLDVLDQHVKSGISHPRLRPVMAVIDPELTLSQPAMVTAASGMDILCHALESYTAKPYTGFDRKQPQQRVPYCGSNPIADMFVERAMGLLSGSFRNAVRNPDDRAARHDMAMAATFAGMGFGNAGVHIPHANAYPIAGRVSDYVPAGYPADHAMVPHGMAVSLTAPATFRWTFDAAPDRHVRAAELLHPGLQAADPIDLLPAALTSLMSDIGIPNGIGAVGFGEGDVTDLVEGTLKQQRLLAISPKTVTPEALAGIITSSIELW